uniref:Uncharacterized protein n=1 Tax=viral metagenome TaxID=1070528 RepID=A0A6C0JYT9_9ZZZZ
MDPVLKSILEKNPNRNEKVSPIPIRVCSDTNETEEAPATLCGWVPTPLEPPGPLAAILWKTNPEFRAGSIPIRRTIIRETILKLQVRVENELRGRRWSRSKITEQLTLQQSADISPPQDTKDLNEALAYFYDIQIVFVDEANKKISWVPEDPRTWSANKPVWAMSVGSRAVFHRKGEESVANHLSQWVSDRENEKWRVIWPVADGTLEEIRSKINTLNVSLGSRLQKPLKADYAIALGRAEAIRHLHDTFSGKAHNNEILMG